MTDTAASEQTMEDNSWYGNCPHCTEYDWCREVDDEICLSEEDVEMSLAHLHELAAFFGYTLTKKED